VVEYRGNAKAVSETDEVRGTGSATTRHTVWVDEEVDTAQQSNSPSQPLILGFRLPAPVLDHGIRRVIVDRLEILRFYAESSDAWMII
jgi:hypothetical protein